MLTIPDKENLFSSWLDEPDSEAFFLNAFPDVPDKKDLIKHLDAILFLSDAGFMYYLQFFMECLKEDPFLYDDLDVCLRVGIKHLSSETKTMCADILQHVAKELEAIETIRYGSPPNYDAS